MYRTILFISFLMRDQWYEVCNALEYLHTSNPILVHGDLKPASYETVSNYH
jgi:serine/threonine protein kinase